MLSIKRSMTIPILFILPFINSYPTLLFFFCAMSTTITIFRKTGNKKNHYLTILKNSLVVSTEGLTSIFFLNADAHCVILNLCFPGQAKHFAAKPEDFFSRCMVQYCPWLPEAITNGYVHCHYTIWLCDCSSSKS